MFVRFFEAFLLLSASLLVIAGAMYVVYIAWDRLSGVSERGVSEREEVLKFRQEQLRKREQMLNSPVDDHDPMITRWIKQRVSDQIASGRTGEQILDWLKQTSSEIPQFIEGKSANDLIEWMKSDPILSGASGSPHFEQTVNERVASRPN